MVGVVAIEFLQLGDSQLCVAKLIVFHEGTVDEHILLLFTHMERNDGQWLGFNDWESIIRNQVPLIEVVRAQKVQKVIRIIQRKQLTMLLIHSELIFGSWVLI